MNPLTVDVAEAADLLKVHPNTVQNLVSRGVLPAAKIGRAYVLLVSDVLAFIQAQVQQQTMERLGAPTRVIKRKPAIARWRDLPPPSGRGTKKMP